MLVNLMLQEAGYSVFRYGYEGVSESLAQIGTLKKRKILEFVNSTPHFVVVDKKKESICLITVKFQGKAASGRNIPSGYERMTKFWPAYLIVVRTSSPYFFLVDEEGEKLKMIPLGKSKVFEVKENKIKKYGQLTRKFLL